MDTTRGKIFTPEEADRQREEDREREEEGRREARRREAREERLGVLRMRGEVKEGRKRPVKGRLVVLFVRCRPKERRQWRWRAGDRAETL